MVFRSNFKEDSVGGVTLENILREIEVVKGLVWLRAYIYIKISVLKFIEVGMEKVKGGKFLVS